VKHKQIRRYSLRQFLILVFGGLTLLVGLPTYLYVSSTYTEKLVRERGESVHDLATAVASVLAADLHERQREIDLMAQSALFRQARLDDPSLRVTLERLQQSYPHYSWLGMVAPDGTVRAATGKLLEHTSVAARPWFQQGLKGSFSGDLHEALLLGRLLPPSTSGDPLHLIDFASPVLDMQGQVRGVLGAHADWGWATDVVQVLKPSNAAQTRVEILIVNKDGRVIHPMRYNGSVELPAALSNVEKFRVDAWKDGVEYLSSMVSVKHDPSAQSMGWRVVVRQPTEQALQDIASLQWIARLLFLGATAVFLLLIWWAATVVSRPLRELTQKAYMIELGQEDTALDTTRQRTLELYELATALRGMARTLLKRKNALAESNAYLERAVAERTAELLKANEELLRQSRQDALTGLSNRLAANERLESEFVRLKRQQLTYTVLLIDIDNFKPINDTHGHATGDQVLRLVAQTLQINLRESDFIARFGGEEFLVLLPATGMASALGVAEKLRRAVESKPVPMAGRVTVSIGLAEATPEDDNEDVAVRQADARLYQAKSAGRNRCSAG
jgi:diguanylate cyclase